MFDIYQLLTALP